MRYVIRSKRNHDQYAREHAKNYWIGGQSRSRATEISTIEEARVFLIEHCGAEEWDIYDLRERRVVPIEETKPEEKKVSNPVYLIHKHTECGERNPEKSCWLHANELRAFYSDYLERATRYSTPEEAIKSMLSCCDERAEVVAYHENQGNGGPIWETIITYKEAKQAQEDAKKAEEQAQKIRWVIHWIPGTGWGAQPFSRYESNGQGKWSKDINKATLYKTKEEAEERISLAWYHSCEAIPFVVPDQEKEQAQPETVTGSIGEIKEMREMKETPDIEFEVIEEEDQPENQDKEEVVPNVEVVNLPFGIDVDDLNGEPIEAEVVYLLWCLKKHGTVKWNYRGSTKGDSVCSQLSTLSELDYFRMYKDGLGYILTTGSYFEA